MKVSVTEKDSCTRVLNVEVEEERVKEKFEEVLKNYKKDIKIPGFRPGKIPRDIVINRFGKALRQEAVESVVSSSFKEACEKENISPISKPVVKKIDSNQGAPLVFEAEIEVEPPVNIENYKDLKIKIEEKKVNSKDIDAVLYEIQERFATMKTVDRAIKKGDYAELEYKKVIIDGQEKQDYENPKYPVEIGNSTLKDFEGNLIGMAKGQEKTVEFTFPEDYSIKEVAGKKAAFTVFIKAVKEKELPLLNDNFAKEVSPGIKNLAELKERIKRDLETENRRTALDKAYREAIDKIINLNPFDVPESRIKSYLEFSYESFKRQYPHAQATPQEFDEKNRDAVVKDLKRYKILEQVAKKENLKALPEEVDGQIDKIASYRKEDFEKTKAALRKSGKILDIRENIREQKTLDFLVGCPDNIKR